MAGRISVSCKKDRTKDGHVFDSMAEMNRYWELKQLERIGIISDLKLQPEFILQPAYTHPVYGKQRAIKYYGDFEYRSGKKTIVEDCKGHVTEMYKLKLKLLYAKYPDINFVEVKA